MKEKIKKVVIFCSNPVNGGTAEIFASLCEELLSRDDLNLDVVPCVNINNRVVAFDRLGKLERINVYSYEDIYGSYYEEKNRFVKIIRKIKYLWIKKRNISEMKSFLGNNHVDSVIIHNGGYVGDDLCNQMLLASYEANVPGERIIVFHSENPGGFWRRVRNAPYDLMVKKTATKVVTVSKYTRDAITKSSFIKGIIVVNNGITAPARSAVDKNGVLKCDKRVVNFLCIGNFLKLKGQSVLLKAFSRAIKKSKTGMKLTIIGNVYDETYYKECLEVIERENISNYVEIVHNLYNAKEYIHLFDIVVFSSVESESLPTVILEAMSAEKPVIAFDCGGAKEIIDSRADGVVIDKGDIQMMAEEMVRLAEDEQLRRELGKMAYEHYCNRYTRKAMGERYFELL